jgi:hypothetical protein
MTPRFGPAVLIGRLGLTTGSADASRVHFFLKIDGSALACESSVNTLDREDWIEAYALKGHLGLISTG